MSRRAGTAAWWRAQAMRGLGIVIACGCLAIVIGAVALTLADGPRPGVIVVWAGIAAVVGGLGLAEAVERWWQP